MQDEKKITYEFIRYIHKTMIHEKIKYGQRSDRTRHDKNGVKVINNENLIEKYDSSSERKIDFMPIYHYEALEEKQDYENLESYIDDADLARSIETLTNQEKLILFMKCVEEKKDTVISKEFGISSQAVSKRKRRILKKLKLQVRKE